MLARRLLRLLKRRFGIEEPEAAFGILKQSAETQGLPGDARALLSGFPDFVTDIDAVMNENEEHLKMAMRNLSLSSAELTASNLALEKFNITNRAILESLGQGLLFFDRDGICAPGYSHACLSLLEGDPSGKHIADVLHLKDAPRGDFVPLIALMFDRRASACSFDDLSALAPPFYAHSKGLHIALSWKAMYDMRKEIIGVLVVATDITQKAKAQEDLKKKEEQVLRTLRIANNRYGYVHCLRGFESIFAPLAEARPLADMRRDIHTLKSMANVFYLHEIAKLLHEIEGEFLRLPAKDWRPGFLNIRDKYAQRLDLGLDYARWVGREIWGPTFESAEDIISIATSELLRFNEDMKTLQAANSPPADTERLFFEKLASLTVYDLLGFFETQLSYFAEVSGRHVRIMHDKGDEVRIFPDFYRDFFDSLTHVARNIMDHAAESAAAREARGKPPELQVRIRTSFVNGDRNEFQLTISDDGQGISREKVAKKLGLKNGEAQEDIIQHIFDEGFSTRAAADMHSGRGIGMNVIKTEVTRLGGSVRVDSKEGAGTTLTITLPMLWRQPDKKQSRCATA